MWDVPRTRPVGLLTGVVAFLLVAGCSGGSSGSSSGGSASPAAPGSAPPPASAPATGAMGTLPVSHPTAWLCRPGMANNPCESNPDATNAGTGTGTTVEKFRPATNPKIDCFYVYPTLSEARSINAPLASEPAAVGVTRSQAARFASPCRGFVPPYPQLPPPAVLPGGHGRPPAPAPAAAHTPPP